MRVNGQRKCQLGSAQPLQLLRKRFAGSHRSPTCGDDEVMAQKSTFDQSKADLICESLEDGESLLSVCRRLSLKESTVRSWAKLNPAFDANYTRAREDGDDIEFERLAEIAAEEPPTVKGFVDSGWVSWKRNQIDTAKWMLARKRPKKYGDKLNLDHSGEVAIKRVVADL